MESALAAEGTDEPATTSYRMDLDLEGFDLDETLAAAEESRRRFAASKAFVSKLPAVEETGNDDVCWVCMEGFDFDQHCSDSEGNKRVPCGHVYHGSCIAAWFSYSDSCPLCRSHVALAPI